MKEKEKHVCKFMKTCTSIDLLYPPHKRFSTIKRKFCESILISEENGRKCFTPQGTAGYIYEKERQLSQSFFIIHPYSKFRQYWEILALTEFFIGIIMRTYLISQFPDITNNSAFQIAGLFADLFESTDVWLRFLIGYMDRETQEVVLENRKVVLRTVKSFSFYSDVIVSFPIEFFHYIINPNPNALLKYVIFLKTFKLYSMTRYLMHMGKIFNWNDLIMRIVWTVYFNGVFSHCISCLFYVIVTEDFVSGAFQVFGSSDNAFLRYIRVYFIVICLIFTHEGLSGKLFDGTLTDIIFYSFLILLLYFNSVAFSGMFIQFLAFVKNSKILFEEVKQEVHKFLAQENLPKHIHLKTMKYLDFRYCYCYFNEEIILKALSPPVRREVMQFLCLDLIQRPNSIFNSLPEDLAVDLCLYMKLEYFIPGDVIFKLGTKSKKIYFLYSGSVAVYSPYGKEVMHWYEGQQFGTSAFLENPIHPVTAIALEMTELYLLKFSDFMNVVRESPKYSKLVIQAARDRVKSVVNLFQWSQ